MRVDLLKVGFFSAKRFETSFFASPKIGYDFFEAELSLNTVNLVNHHDVICGFVNDRFDRPVLEALASKGVKLIALRCAGFNNVDLPTAKRLNIPVVRVPEYSPYAVAEHALALLMTLNRKTHRAYNRVREGNFSLDGLMGFDLHGKTIGVFGTGRIGRAFAKVMLGMGCKVIAYDLKPEPELSALQVQYLPKAEVLSRSDVVSLHLPLTRETFHFLTDQEFSLMKEDVVLLNTSRGALIDTRSLIQSLKEGKVKAAGLDVYEEEEGLFFHDHSNAIIKDDQISRLMTFPNVLITSHQGFLTKEALTNIAQTTEENIVQYFTKGTLQNSV